jgi:hypothetical protein
MDAPPSTVRCPSGGESLLFPAAIRFLVARDAPAGARAGTAVEALTPARAGNPAAEGPRLSNAEIADELFLGLQTVKTHVRLAVSAIAADRALREWPPCWAVPGSGRRAAPRPGRW